MTKKPLLKIVITTPQCTPVKSTEPSLLRAQRKGVFCVVDLQEAQEEKILNTELGKEHFLKVPSTRPGMEVLEGEQLCGKAQPWGWSEVPTVRHGTVWVSTSSCKAARKSLWPEA